MWRTLPKDIDEWRPEEGAFAIVLLALGLILIVLAVFLLKRKFGTQGWRRWIGRAPWAVGFALAWTWRKTLGRLPWKPILIWGPWVLIVGVVVFYGIENWRGQRALEKAKARWDERGISYRLRDFVPEKVPDEEDFSRHPAVIAGHSSHPHVQPVHMRQLHGFSSSPGDFTQKRIDLAQPADVGLWLHPAERMASEQEAARKALDFMSPVNATMDEIGQAAATLGCNLPIGETAMAAMADWGERFSYFHFMGAFDDRGLLHLRAGEPDLALADLESLFHLVQIFENDPYLIGGLLGVAGTTSIERLVWEGLCAGGWSDEQLASIDAVLNELEFVESGYRRLQCEAAFGVEVLETMAEDRRSVEALMGGQIRLPLNFLIWSSSPSWWDDFVDEAEVLGGSLLPRGWMRLWTAEAMGQLEELVFSDDLRESGRITIALIERLEERVGEPEDRFMEELRNTGLDTYLSAARRFFYMQARIDLQRVAIALERHRLRYSGYPEALAQLVPEFLQEVPLDRVAGEPLRYYLKFDGTPLVYGVGFNRKDDGGFPAKDPQELDWIWQYTPAVGQAERMWRLGEKPKPKAVNR